MYIITTKNKGPHIVIVGFRKQHIDPQATRAATSRALGAAGLPEYYTSAQTAVDNAVGLPKRTKGRRSMIDAAHNVLLGAQKQYAAECGAEQAKHIQYLPPKAGEILMSNEDSRPLRKKFKQLKRKEFLTPDGEVIKNTVGWEYWVEVDGRWGVTTIAEFGETPPAGSKVMRKLNSNQRKAIRDQKSADKFGALTAQQKSEMYSNDVRGAELEAVTRRSLDEINGADAARALLDAQEWLEARKIELAAKYK